MLRRKIRSVLDKYTTSKFKHCEFNPQQGAIIFFILENKLRLFFFLIFFTFVLEHSFMFIIYIHVLFFLYIFFHFISANDMTKMVNLLRLMNLLQD